MLPDPTPTLLAESDPATRERLTARALTRTVERGTYLHFSGDPVDRIHMVLNGSFLLVSSDPTGGESILGLAVAGEPVADAGFVRDEDHDLDAIAATRSTVVGLDPEVFRDEAIRDPRLARGIATFLQERLRWSRRAAHELSCASVPGRVAGRLLELARVVGGDDGAGMTIELPVDQANLARLAGTSRESACRALRRFKSTGVVDYQGRKLRILRPDVLHRLRCGGRIPGPLC